jgi:hypothetical protein
MTDVEYAPDGTFIVVSTSGAWGGAASNNGTSGCDVVARFGTNGSATRVLTPAWTAYTVGDTTWTVEVTDKVVYAGGHQRWQNNPTVSNQAGQGAVSRTGIAALNTLNGMPYSWNPTRTRGVGVQDMLANGSGLFVGSDTDVFAGETHRSLAFVPLSTGKVLPTYPAATLPANVYTVGIGQSQLVRRGFDGTRVTSSATVPDGPGWGNVVGAFKLGTTLYTATADGNLRKQTFDGTTYGPASLVDTADLLVRQTAWHAGDVPFLTSLFYSGGRIYFTKSGSTRLYSRGFEPESDVVGQLRYSSASVAGVPYGNVRGAFVAGGRLYFADTTGRLFAATWSGTAAVAGTATLLGSAGSTWASRAMFVDS